MTDQLQGPIFMVHLEADEPWIEEIRQMCYLSESELRHHDAQMQKRVSLNSKDFTPVTSLTSAELFSLPEGQQMLDAFMAGDTSARDREELPHTLEIAREHLKDGLDDEEATAYINGVEARLREVNASPGGVSDA